MRGEHAGADGGQHGPHCGGEPVLPDLSEFDQAEPVFEVTAVDRLPGHVREEADPAVQLTAEVTGRGARRDAQHRTEERLPIHVAAPLPVDLIHHHRIQWVVATAETDARASSET